jgi:hypothetical protein
MVSISQSELDKILDESAGQGAPLTCKREPKFRKVSVSRRKQFSGVFSALTQDELDRTCKGNS